MRILIVIPSWMSFAGFFTELADELLSKGVEVHCACAPESVLDGAASFAGSTVQLHPIRFPRGMNPMDHCVAARQLRRVVETVQPDIIHAHFSAAIFTTALACHSRWPVTLATFHGISYPFFKGLKRILIRSAELWSARRMRCAWVLNEEDRRQMNQDGAHQNVRVLSGFGLGCDVERFHGAVFSSPARAAFRMQLGIPPDACVFIFVGRFVAFKGFGTLVRAFLGFAGAHPGSRLLLVGTPDRLHSSGLTKEEEHAMRGCKQVVRVGYQQAVERYLGVADVFVFPSQREGMPVCLMESLAMGVPVITLNVRGCRDVVRNGFDGVILEQGTEEDVSAAMHRLIADPGYREQLARNALAGRDRFSRKHYVNAQVEYYSQLGRAPSAAVEHGEGHRQMERET
jgi:glycosyltransferase involved in cell wall biosynthesis